MSSDISRQRFQPTDNFSSVLMQQGRVQLDADWNEWNEILDRRWRSETIDIIGRGVVPREMPEGFEIKLQGDSLTIGRGRIYVDGLQAENHGSGTLEFDPILGESRGVDPTAYEEQPYFPKATALPASDAPAGGISATKLGTTTTTTKDKTASPAKDATAKAALPGLSFRQPRALPKAGGPHLVYLDVWEREVTAVEEPNLREVALGGPDTTTRLQTVWQVRVLPDVGADASCGDDDLPGWQDLIRPSAGRLTTAAVGVASVTDPCLIPPSGGYRGLENRTYRVEIHDGGPVGTATFKWSRDNASLATGVSAIENDTVLTVERAVWDSVRRFKEGDWIEITDDVREFSGAPGEIRQIKGAVEEGTRRITLDQALPAGAFASDNAEVAERRTRIKRWDQTGSDGVIEVPGASDSLILEDGVEVTFSVDHAGGEFQQGDYWIFAARTADASVEVLEDAPPRGVHHHYCRLALITLPGTVTNCRIFWPPPLGAGGEDCDCTLCVSAEQHNGGAFTIHEAVGQIAKTGGTICLGPGIFNLQETPVQLQSALGVRLRGQGAATILIKPRADAAFVINQSQWCTLDYFTIHTLGGTSVGPAIRLGNSVGTTLERLIVGPPTTEGNGPDVGVSLETGFLTMTKIRDNFIWAQTGVSFAAAPTPALPPTATAVGTAPSKAAATGLSSDVVRATASEASFSQAATATAATPASRLLASDPIAVSRISSSTTISGTKVGATGTIPVSGQTSVPASGDVVPVAGAGQTRPPITAETTVPVTGTPAASGVFGVSTAPSSTAPAGTIGTPAATEPAGLVLSAFYCEKNVMRCSDTGVQLDPGSFYLNATVISRNLVYDSGVAGISVTGFAGGEVELSRNAIAPLKGDGIIVGTGGSRVADNQITNFNHDAENGIRVVPGAVALALFPLVISGNRLQGLRGNGISIEKPLISAKIEQNVLNAVEGNGIIMLPGSAAGSLKVVGNELINIAITNTQDARSLEIAAIFLRVVFEGAVSDNSISAIGINSPLASVIAGVRLESCVDVRVSNNSITNLAPATNFSNPAAGVLVTGAFTNMEIADNLIRRQIEPQSDDNSPWQAIRILGISQAAPTGSVFGLANFTEISAIGRVSAVNSLAAAAAPLNEQVGITSNSLHGYGQGPLVFATITDSCRFSDNQCTCSSEKAAGVVNLTANSVIASANRVQCGRNTVALNLQVVGKTTFTVVGNILGGPAVINNATLAAPWLPLNLIGA